MEKKFLLYLLYTFILEVRERSHEIEDKRLYWLSDLLHNVPLNLETEEDVKAIYDVVVAKVKHLEIDDWFNVRWKDFEESSYYKR